MVMPHSLNGTYPDGHLQVAWEDAERVFHRGWRRGEDGKRQAVLIAQPTAQHPSPSTLVHLDGRTALVLDDPGGEPLDQGLGAGVGLRRFLPLAIAIAAAVGKVHQQGLIHKDLKPANILVDEASGEVRLTGFGIASRLSRERQAVKPPETIAGTLPYMAPEQTGRMKRSIDSRSDL